MRALKFRAYDGKVYTYFDIYDVPNSNTLDGCAVEQFTGLLDKQGKEIYEGDVVRWQSSHAGASQDYHIDAMTWDDMGACYLLMPWIREPYAAEMEVIGNIYETPGLMEGR
jgi:hypothetical protein